MGDFRVIQKGTNISTGNKVITIAKIATQGPPGIHGDAGERGPMGPVGASYTTVISQPFPSNIWMIQHNLGKYPSIIVKDSAGTTVEGDVEYLDLNTVRIIFSGAFSGVAYFN